MEPSPQEANGTLHIVCFWRDGPHWDTAFSFTRFLYHTRRRTTIGRTPLDEVLARRRSPPNTQHSRQISIRSVGFEPTISAGERPQTSHWDRRTLHGMLDKVGQHQRSCNDLFHRLNPQHTRLPHLPPPHARVCNIKSISLADDTAMPVITGSQVQPNPTLSGMSGQA